jgi:RNA polymerase-binding transcription factor DksA
MMKHLTPTHIAELRAQLLAREQQLATEIEAALARRHEQPSAGREVDQGVLDLDTALGFAEALRDQTELDAVRAALGRIDRGTFGRCLGCGAHVPIERLHVQPDAALCHVCQSRAEAQTGPGLSAP